MSTTTNTRVIDAVESTPSAQQEPRRPGTPWMRTAGRAIGGAAGVVFIVLGAVALIRTGLPTTLSQFTGIHVEAGWLHHTTLLALIHLVVGASLVSAVGYWAIGERAITTGIVVLVLGLIVWIEPTALHDTFGIHRVHGLTYGLAGVAMALAGWLISRSATVVYRHVQV